MKRGAIDIPFNEGWIHFTEIELDRQMFAVAFCVDIDGKPYSPDVYVQDDIGCGFVEIPFPWGDLTIEYFESVYYGIRGHKPKPTPQSFTDTEYEIIEPKRLKQ
jgi:hypothetical protein